MKKKLADVPDEAKVKAAFLFEIFEREIGINKKLLLSKSRKDNLAVMRAMCVHVLIKVEQIKICDVAAIFDKDHATMLHAEKIHHNSYDTDFDGYKDKYERLISVYLFEKEKEGEQNTEIIPMFDIIGRIDKRQAMLARVKKELIDSLLNGSKLDPETIEIINEIFPEDDKRRIIEQNIANGIQLG